MPEYTLIVKIPNAGDKEFRHTFNLPSSFVDFPSDYFRKPENRTKLQNDIENQSGRQVTDADLEVFIKEWCWDIRQGLTPTTVSRDLLPLGTAASIATQSLNQTSVFYAASTIDKKHTDTNSHHQAKRPNNHKSSGNFSDSKNPSTNATNNQQEKEESPKTETRATSNDYDF